MLESRKAPNEIFRIGRKPDPWQPPDWSRANSDGTFGNRFDDPAGYYRVLYAASRPVSCFVETLARFRPDLTLRAELSEIQGEDDFVPLGEVPLEWCDQRLIGTSAADGDYADIYSSVWIAHLRPKLADECLRLGLQDLDAAVLQNAAPRRISQLASRQAYELGCPAFTIARATGMIWKIGPFSSRFRSIREAPKKSTRVMSLFKKRMRF